MNTLLSYALRPALDQSGDVALLFYDLDRSTQGVSLPKAVLRDFVRDGSRLLEMEMPPQEFVHSERLYEIRLGPLHTLLIFYTGSLSLGRRLSPAEFRSLLLDLGQLGL